MGTYFNGGQINTSVTEVDPPPPSPLLIASLCITVLVIRGTGWWP